MIITFDLILINKPNNMKNLYLSLSVIAAMTWSMMSVAQSDLIVTGVFDGPLTGGTPKAIEVYVVNDIADLSIYGFGSANNGGGTDGEEFTFPADAVSAGTYFYISTTTAEFNTFFGFDPQYVTNDAGINGDDAVEIFLNGEAVDVFGELTHDGDIDAWDYLDGWAYRVDGTGPSTTFNTGEWMFSGINAMDGETDNASAANPWPLGTYSPEGGGEPEVVTIVEIQETSDPEGNSPLLGEVVTTTGIVTAHYGNGFWIQDGTGPWTGVFVRQTDPQAVRGDEVTVTGTVQENFGLTRLGNPTEVTINSSGNDLPEPSTISTFDAGTEPYEGVLIEVLNVTCFDNDLGFGEWAIDDGTGAYRADDELYNAGPEMFAGYDLVGISHYSFDDFKLLPRDADDVTLNADADMLGLGFATIQQNVGEADGSTTVTVVIYNPDVTATSVDVVATGGDAINGTHYNLEDPFTVTFPAGEGDPISFDFDIIDDEEPNENRTIILELQNATNNAALGASVMTITIQDDDTEIEVTDIGIVAEVDADGVAIHNGEEYTVGGVVYGVNMNGNGLSFTMRDHTGGIGVYSNVVVDGYTVVESDSILLTGTVDQFNGLTQLNPSAITLVSTGHPLSDPIVVTEFDESLESNLLKLECVFLTDPGQWSGTGSGFNVTVSNGTQEFDLRIDNDVDLYSLPAPGGTFDVVGILGQFDNSFPYLDGYQLFPRYAEDITPQDCGIVTPPVNDNCLAAIALDDLLGGNIGEAMNSAQYSNDGATVAGDDPSAGWDCFGEPDGSGTAPSLDNNVWFSFTGDGNTYFVETNNCDGTAEDYIPFGDTQMAVYTGICGLFASPYACNDDSPNATGNHFPAGLTIETVEGQSYLIMIDGFDGLAGDFCISFTRQPLANDDCEGATDLSDLMNGPQDEMQTSGTFTNVGATSENDPNPNDEQANCWFGDPLVEQTVWASFVGDGNVYFIETLDCGVDNYIPFGDTQMAIYSGECDALVFEDCNEDGPQASEDHYPAGITFEAEEGVTYYVMIDGYEGDAGEFCIGMTNQGPIGVSDMDSFEFTAYPNPTKGKLTIESVESIEGLTLLNLPGQQVMAWTFGPTHAVEVDMRDVPAGLYFLQARSQGKVSVHKVVVE